MKRRTKLKIEALNDHVIVKIVDNIEIKTDGGIVIPETVIMEPQKYGIVISRGPKCDANIEEGDTIIFAKHGGQDIIIDNKSVKVLKQGEIYGVIRK